MGNKGQVFFLAFMIGLVIIIAALAFAPVLKEGVDTARNSSNMDCTNSSISAFDKTACIATDSSLFYFIGGLIFIAGAVITAKVVAR